MTMPIICPTNAEADQWLMDALRSGPRTALQLRRGLYSKAHVIDAFYYVTRWLQTHRALGTITFERHGNTGFWRLADTHRSITRPHPHAEAETRAS